MTGWTRQARSSCSCSCRSDEWTSRGAVAGENKQSEAKRSEGQWKQEEKEVEEEELPSRFSLLSSLLLAS